MRAPAPELDYQHSDAVYLCRLCPKATGTKDWRRHCSGANHKRNVQLRDEARRLSEQVRNETPIIQRAASLSDLNEDHTHEDHIHTERVWERIERFLALDHQPGATLDTNASALDAFLDEMEGTGAIHEGAGVGDGAGQGPNWHGLTETALMGIEVDKDDHIIEDPPILRTDKRSDRVNNSPWYPFKSKMDLIASLIPASASMGNGAHVT
ncbi:hypothetical protein PGTUg99_009275 [Puccinia graminis f. sp. tritici]|uniref:U1-type domain-containing protein n=1 Tax=Puccinia graminis f. sp. tritici TaxID=56615 RepID=A0A5B0MHF9_PUCGR|nr:hypothetical protein PGTUg99_009275 [Puccinia graminis f. sp. tritici]